MCVVHKTCKQCLLCVIFSHNTLFLEGDNSLQVFYATEHRTSERLAFVLYSVWSFVVSGTEYMYMNTPVCRNGTSFVESLFEKFGEYLVDFIFLSHEPYTLNKHGDIFLQQIVILVAWEMKERIRRRSQSKQTKTLRLSMWGASVSYPQTLFLYC